MYFIDSTFIDIVRIVHGAVRSIESTDPTKNTSMREVYGWD
ncbi:MAG: hypothetical protein K0R34_3971 [Herbinix sp.]|jgi:hypothetical protein|nr:hypothetical protein [Herbinix sp.]